ALTGSHGIRERLQPPSRGDGRIELPQRAGRRVPRVGKDGLAPLLALAVDLLELLVRQKDLAPHLDEGAWAAGRRLPAAGKGGILFADGRRLTAGGPLRIARLSPCPQTERQLADRAQILGDVLARRPISSRGAHRELSVLIRQ